ncbi:MAG: ABC transporter ATP-binding protein [Dehalococcoidia bacterium]
MSSEVTTSAEAALSLRGVSRRYRFLEPGQELKTTLLHPLRAWRRRKGKPFSAVRGVTLDIFPGEFFAIVGANGSGKSTLLRLMAGLSRPSSGTVVARGRISTLLELGSGFHPQVSGRENAILNGLLMGRTRAEMEAQLPRIIEFAGLQQFIDQPMRTYSSGMYVRLGFAIAAFLEPEILLVDEVLAVGDAVFQERCYEHIEGLRDRGVTVVMVSHDLAAVQRFATRAALMERGRIVMVGEPADVLDEHLGRLAKSSPEIMRALDEAMEEQREAIEDLIGRSPEARARFERALERNPEFLRKMEEQQRAQAEAGERHE